MKLKSVIIWSIGIAVVLFGVFVMPFLIWNNQASTPLNVLVSNKDQVLVLKDREAINKDGVRLSLDPAYAKQLGISSSFSYDQWFDLVQTQRVVGDVGYLEFGCY